MSSIFEVDNVVVGGGSAGSRRSRPRHSARRGRRADKREAQEGPAAPADQDATGPGMTREFPESGIMHAACAFRPLTATGPPAAADSIRAAYRRPATRDSTTACPPGHR